MNKTVGSVTIDLPIEAIEKDLKEAHRLLNMQIVADCTPLIPFQQGALRGSVEYPQGIYGNEIEWNTPYAHYMYEGELYVDPITGKGAFYSEDYGFWSRPNVAKVPSGRPITYRQGTDHWFDKAKDANLDSWVKLVGECLE